jgi:hypothetical protein
LVKLLLIMLHKNPSFQGWSLGPRIRTGSNDTKRTAGAILRFIG